MVQFRKRSGFAAVFGAVVALGMAGAAVAENRDPAYAAARAAGQVGEQRDGYLGVVPGAPATVSAMVKDLNNRRRAIYTEKAAGKSTIEEYAFTTACRLILQTTPGEKYQGLDGSWKTRGAGAPERDPKCP